MSFTFEQFYVSTAEDERNYFTRIAGEDSIPAWPNNPLPPGQYRVLAGQLYRIAQGIPPELDRAVNATEEKESGWLLQA